ncbi:MAG: TIGR03000 domain-containing protein, partial [Pirellulaceae bacterium]
GVSSESGYGSSGSSWSAPSDGVIYEGSSGSMAPIITPTTSVEPDAIHLYVQVPESAKVFINGKATTSTGATRHYVSRGVEAGSSYRFEIRAEVGDGEQKQVEERSVVIAGGRRETVQIAFREVPRQLETKVTLRVPADAKVTLAGNSTESHGALRTFTTANLKEGMVWDDYTIEVTHQGQTKKQALRLVAGDQLELAFQFEDSESRLAAK